MPLFNRAPGCGFIVHREFIRSGGRHWSRRPLLATTCRAFPTTARHDRQDHERQCGILPWPMPTFSVLHNASASGISGAPAVGSALLAHGGSGLADTVNHHPARAAAHTGLRDHVIRLSKRRWHRCLRRCRDGQRKASSSINLNSSPPFVDVSLPSNSVSFGKRKLPWRNQPSASFIQIKDTFRCL